MSVRAGVVLLQDGMAALIRRAVDLAGERQVYYLFPGGKVEAGEDQRDAARREALEELGLAIEVGRLLAIVQRPNGNVQYYYQALAIGGAFGTGVGAEMTSADNTTSGSYTPVWIAVGELTALDVRPRRLAEAVLANPRLDWSSALKIRE